LSSSETQYRIDSLSSTLFKRMTRQIDIFRQCVVNVIQLGRMRILVNSLLMPRWWMWSSRQKLFGPYLPWPGSLNLLTLCIYIMFSHT